MIHKNRKEFHKEVENYITRSIHSIAQGNLEEANAQLESALHLDFNYKRVLIGLNYLKFWMDRIEAINTMSDPLAIISSILNNWKQFKKHIHSSAHIDEQIFLGFRHFLFNRILLATKDFSHKIDQLLWSGIAYKGLGNLQDAQDSLVAALQLDPGNAQVLAELADTCSLLGQEQRARAFFREAFYISPQDIDIDNLESNFINDLIDRVRHLRGKEGEIIREWIPVYGSAFHVFQIKRELRVVEYGKLRQNIFKLEQKLKEGDSSFTTVPRLLNYYFWLIDYMIINEDEQARIQEILLKVESISPEIYEAYTGEKSRQT